MKSGSLCCAILAIEKKNPYTAMLLVQFIYAGMALFSKAAIATGMNPYVFVFYRLAFATLALAPFALFLKSEKAVQLSYNLLWKIFLISLFGITPSLNLYSYAINYTSATFAAATTNSIPAITFAMAVLLRMESISIGERHGMAKVFGCVLGVSGAFVFGFIKGPPIKFMNWFSGNQKHVLGSSVQKISKGEWVKGSLIMLLANTVWSLWLIMQAKIIKQYPAKVRLITLQCAFSCLLSAAWAVGLEKNKSWKLGWDINLFSVAYCGVVVGGISYWLQMWAIEKKGPVFTAIFTPLALIITIIFSAFLWRECLHWGSVFGAILLIGGLYSVLWGKNKEAERETSDQKSETKEETMLDTITVLHH